MADAAREDTVVLPAQPSSDDFGSDPEVRRSVWVACVWA
jgi:hypothetical protein